jgi:ABC-type Na+ efflux pump permease subunit
MRNILIIAKHEVLRFKSRFSGKTRWAVLLIALAALAVFFFISIGGFVISKGFYTVGISPDMPGISDQRFNVFIVEPAAGLAMLKTKQIDIYVDTETAYFRDDSRSQYATGALKQYLEKRELVRISNEYDIEKAFPLRIEINYLKPSDNATAAGVSLADIIQLGQAPSNEQQSGSSNVISAPVNPPDSSDTSVKQQLQNIGNAANLHRFEAEFAKDKDVIIPSLMNPPIPLAQVLLAFFYIVPIFFIIIFFTSSFIEEKLNRRLLILLSAPVKPAEIILGKMLPYFTYSVIVIILITVFLKGNILLALAIFIPIVLFIFAIYLGVALLYRTFKDQTFFSMMAVTVITVYLVFPAMFTGINNLCYISPLSLAVQMYRGEQFNFVQYLFGTGPMYLTFVLGMVAGIRVFNEEYLMNYKPMFNKLSEAIYFALDKKRKVISVFLASLLLIPVVFMVELGGIAFALNLPLNLAMPVLIIIAVFIEEVAKSAAPAVLIKYNLVKSWKSVLLYAVVAAVAFFLGEKLLLFFSMSVISESVFTTVLFSSKLIWLPLVIHIAATSTVCLLTYKMGSKYYILALLGGVIIHLIYNFMIIGAAT